ncbi:MAG: hypothetical protein LR008_03550, partial [Candidatus Pacebacteria bacterium]|nr:hypothetical protein [Candidatus Paceibacterota bacterium]
LIISCFTLIILITNPVLAQFDTNSFIDSESGIELKPMYPRPGEEVIATLNDYNGASFGSDITWFLDGDVISETKNQRQVVFVAGQSGVSQKIQAVLTKDGGSRQVLANIFTPLYLDLVVEAQTHVPDFYIGRALPSIGSTVNVTALVDGDIEVSDLIFTWRINRVVIEGGSLRGRNKVSYTTPRGSNSTLSLEITNLGGRALANRAILVPSVEPTILFYEVSSLFGTKNKAVKKSLPLIGQSIMVRAEPYNLDSNVYNNPSISEWSVDRENVKNTNQNPYDITIQRALESGVASLNFHVRDTQQVLQGAEASIQINL